MKIKLVTDSTCDLSKEYLASRGIEFLPLSVIFGEDHYLDKIDLSNAEFFAKMAKSKKLPSTSQVNAGEFIECFERLLKDPETIVLALLLSSDLSGTYSSADMAKNYIGSDRIHLIDSRTVTFALGSMICLVQDEIDRGADIEQVKAFAHKLIENNRTLAIMDTLENLHKGGRLPLAQTVIGSVLGVKPILEIKDGLVGVRDKVRGFKKGYAYIMEFLNREVPSKVLDFLGVGHANAPERAQELAELIRASFQVKQMEIVDIGPVVGVHAGAGAVGVTFFK